MQFKPIVPGVEVYGTVLQFMVSGFRIVPSVAYGYLSKFGIFTLKPGEAQSLPVDAWYPFDRWLQVFEAVYREVGPNATFEIGREVGSRHPLPPHVKDHLGLLRFVDLGYHLNHRLNGRVMYDMATGVLLEGIGHYNIEIDASKRRSLTVCDNPYPCEFDHGLAQAFGSRFEPKARTAHDRGPCRARGDDRCTYITTW
jgi:hypothetical protein